MRDNMHCLFFYNSIDVNALNMHYILKIRSTFTIPCRTISVRCRKNQMCFKKPSSFGGLCSNDMLFKIYIILNSRKTKTNLNDNDDVTNVFCGGNYFS